MQNTEVQKELEKFRDYVISQAKSNLTRNKKKYSGALYNSLKGVVKTMPNSISIEFSMEDYGVFQDEGVQGKDPNKVSPNAKITGQQAPNSRYKFGNGSAKGKWSLFKSNIEKWAKTKNVRFRDQKGKYTKGSYKGLAHVIASNIYARGLKPSMFFTKPFEDAYQRLPQELVEKYGLDAIKLFNEQIDQIIKQNG
jgi:hypothetical protein